MNRRWFLLVFILTPIAVAGCPPHGKSNMPPLHSVHGVVTRDGVVVKDALVRFTPDVEDQSLTISAMTDAAGKYEMQTLYVKGAINEKKPGAPEGSYTVTVVMPLDEKQRGGEVIKLPEKIQVKAGANDFQHELNPRKK
jgi:hypothetical protein